MVKQEEIVSLQKRMEVFLENLEEFDFQVKNMTSDGIRWFIKNRVNLYNEIKREFNQIVEGRNLNKNIVFLESIPSGSKEDTAEYFDFKYYSLIIKRRISSAIKVLETIRDNELETTDMAEAITLRGKIKEYKDGYKDIYKNLDLAIESFEQGQMKAASMISGLVVDYVSDELKSILNVGGWKEAYNELEEKGKIDPSTEGNISKALKESRNNVSHDLDNFPTEEKALLLISGTIQLVEIFDEVKEE